MNIFQKIGKWIVDSSQDPSQVSLTLKGFLVMLVPSAMMFFGFTHISIGPDLVTNVVNSFVVFVQDALTTVAAAAMLIGAVRKLYYGIFPPKAATPFLG